MWADKSVHERPARGSDARVPPSARTGCAPVMQIWIGARSRQRRSHAQVQMARELGMNPKKLGGKANHKQEPWKMPLPQFIEYCYQRRFGKKMPDDVCSIEKKVARKCARKAMKKRSPDIAPDRSA